MRLPSAAPHTPLGYFDLLWGGYSGFHHGHLAAAYRRVDPAWAFFQRWYRQVEMYRRAADIPLLDRHSASDTEEPFEIVIDGGERRCGGIMADQDLGD